MSTEQIHPNLVKINRLNPITGNKQEIFILGTAHVSKKSAQDVRDAIEMINPSTVALELCETRYNKLVYKQKWLNTNIFDVIKRDEHLLFLLNIVLSNYQKSIGDELGVMPGSEFIEAERIAKDRGIEVKLVDRDIGITLKRAHQFTPLLDKAKVLYAILLGFFSSRPTEKTIEELKSEDMLNKALDEFGSFSPSLKNILVDERNTYIASKTLQINSDRILLVVGAGHSKEIAKILDTNTDAQDISKLDYVKTEVQKANYFGFLVLLSFIIIISYGLYAKGFNVALSMLGWWILSTGLSSALGAIIAGGSIYTILVSFVLAPITTINPLLAVGWFAGLTELKVRKPTVQDFFKLKDIKSLWDFRKNPVSRVLLVVTLTNIGASIGTLIAFPLIIRLLF